MERKDEAKTGRNEDVVNCLYRRPNAMCTLICFPWAGSGSIHFAKWGKDMQDSLEVHSIRLAGRESRHEEPFSSDICQIADEIVCALLPVLQDKPFAFFGHSLGSYIAFMTALHLKEKHKLEPMHLFVSSTAPPYCGDDEKTLKSIPVASLLFWAVHFNHFLASACKVPGKALVHCGGIMTLNYECGGTFFSLLLKRKRSAPRPVDKESPLLIAD
ncbi:S-acyl fatty acid synthase thioesterase, medium chain-like [Molossus nigricans]